VSGTDVRAARDQDLLRLRRQAVGVIPQDFALLPLLTAAENIGVPLRIARADPAERERRVAELLERVGLEKHANQRPDEMSGG
jgi:putative ABC transport system ATP-binding protein